MVASVPSSLRQMTLWCDKPEHFHLIRTHVCMVYLRLPNGRELMFVPDFLAARPGTACYIYASGDYRPVSIDASGVACSPIIEAGKYLTEDELTTVMSYAQRVELLSDRTLSGEPVDRIIWSSKDSGKYKMDWVVGLLELRGKVKTRCTEHEYRDDDRDLIWVEGWDLKGPCSVDSLYIDQPDETPSHSLRNHLLALVAKN